MCEAVCGSLLRSNCYCCSNFSWGYLPVSVLLIMFHCLVWKISYYIFLVRQTYMCMIFTIGLTQTNKLETVTIDKIKK